MHPRKLLNKTQKPVPLKSIRDRFFCTHGTFKTIGGLVFNTNSKCIIICIIVYM